jgi:FtsP/CotA-like multicopper oxidase with cupredoxin domain
MVRIDVMADRILRLDRRGFMVGVAATALGPTMSGTAAAQGRVSLVLQAKAENVALRPGASPTPIWSLQSPAPDPGIRFKRGDELEITLRNDLPVPTLFNCQGIDGVAATEPLVVLTPLLPGARETIVFPLRHAGTLMCDLRLLGDAQARPSSARALVVGESEAVAVDREQVLLIEDWRLRPNGDAIAPGADPTDTVATYTINGKPTLDVPVRVNERLRFRIINGCQRIVIAVKFEGHEVRVMAMDGEPAEPFSARGGALVLAPGGRVDAFVDITAKPGSTSSILLHDGTDARPLARLIASQEPFRNATLPAAPALPSNGLPAQLDLKGALRVDLTLGGPPADWVTPARFAVAAAPAFRAKAGRTVVLALTNRAAIASVFHLHGHHFRLLDRLDDGWKPFWLDTLAIDAGQTQRVAFAAEHAGRWLIETMATDWAAPRLVKWYCVE